MCKGTIIEIDHLPKDIREKLEYEQSQPAGVIGNEVDEILQALEKTRWNRIEAASLLGIDRSTLYRKMKK